MEIECGSNNGGFCYINLGLKSLLTNNGVVGDLSGHDAHAMTQ